MHDPLYSRAQRAIDDAHRYREERRALAKQQQEAWVFSGPARPVITKKTGIAPTGFVSA